MSTVYEVNVKATFLGQDHYNVWHLYDGNDDANPVTIANYFLTDLVQPVVLGQSAQFNYQQISVKSLTATNPAAFVLGVDESSTNADDPMPSGNHLYVKLVSSDPSFRAGGKMWGGWTEPNFTNGQPVETLLDFLQIRLDAFLSNLFTGTSTTLAIYRPTLSVPGFPEISVCNQMIVRGASTNNRRRQPFQR